MFGENVQHTLSPITQRRVDRSRIRPPGGGRFCPTIAKQVARAFAISLGSRCRGGEDAIDLQLVLSVGRREGLLDAAPRLVLSAPAGFSGRRRSTHHRALSSYAPRDASMFSRRRGLASPRDYLLLLLLHSYGWLIRLAAAPSAARA